LSDLNKAFKCQAIADTQIRIIGIPTGNLFQIKMNGEMWTIPFFLTVDLEHKKSK
jgi:hypothetical protein